MNLLDALHTKPLSTPPVWMMRQAGRYLPEYRAVRKNHPNFIDFCLTPDAATEVTLQPLERFNLNAAILFADILLIPHALGINVTFTVGHGPVLDKLKTKADIQNLLPFVQESAHKLAPVYKTVRQTRAALPQDKALIGFCGAPWTVACYMMDDKPSADALNLRQLAYADPASFAQLIDILIDSSVAYLCGQAKAGANALMIFDSWAGLVPPALFERAVQTPLLTMIERVRAQYPNIPFILFPRNVSQDHLKQLAQKVPAAVALALSHTVSPAWAAQHLQPHCPVQGNFDPAILLSNPATIQAETIKMLDQFKTKKGYIANLGHGINKETPAENVQAFLETIHHYDPS